MYESLEVTARSSSSMDSQFYQYQSAIPFSGMNSALCLTSHSKFSSELTYWRLTTALFGILRTTRRGCTSVLITARRAGAFSVTPSSVPRASSELSITACGVVETGRKSIPNSSQRCQKSCDEYGESVAEHTRQLTLTSADTKDPNSPSDPGGIMHATDLDDSPTSHSVDSASFSPQRDGQDTLSSVQQAIDDSSNSTASPSLPQTPVIMRPVGWWQGAHQVTNPVPVQRSSTTSVAITTSSTTTTSTAKGKNSAVPVTAATLKPDESSQSSESSNVTDTLPFAQMTQKPQKNYARSPPSSPSKSNRKSPTKVSKTKPPQEPCVTRPKSRHDTVDSTKNTP